MVLYSSMSCSYQQSLRRAVCLPPLELLLTSLCEFLPWADLTSPFINPRKLVPSEVLDFRSLMQLVPNLEPVALDHRPTFEPNKEEKREKGS